MSAHVYTCECPTWVNHKRQFPNPEIGWQMLTASGPRSRFALFGKTQSITATSAATHSAAVGRRLACCCRHALVSATTAAGYCSPSLRSRLQHTLRRTPRVLVHAHNPSSRNLASQNFVQNDAKRIHVSSGSHFIVEDQLGGCPIKRPGLRHLLTVTLCATSFPFLTQTWLK